MARRPTYGNWVRIVVLSWLLPVGDTNTVENRRDIALGKYTHIWISAEAVLGDLVEKKS